MKLITRILLLGLLVLFGPIAHGDQLSCPCEVVKVLEGDTINVTDQAGRRFKVRLVGIDAPETDQAFGDAARKNLSRLILGQTVEVVFEKRDSDGTILGKVLLDGLDINLKQVQDGFAWHYKQYQRDQSATDRQVYAAAEVRARNAQQGLWTGRAIPPWDFRRGPGENGVVLAAPPPPPPPPPRPSPSPTRPVQGGQSPTVVPSDPGPLTGNGDPHGSPAIVEPAPAPLPEPEPEPSGVVAIPLEPESDGELMLLPPDDWQEPDTSSPEPTSPESLADEYEIKLAADAQMSIPGPPGTLIVWIGSIVNTPDFSESFATDQETIPNLGDSAKVRPIAPNFTIEPSETQCFRIVPSGSQKKFTLTPKATGEFRISAEVELYDSNDCSGVPVPKSSSTLEVKVSVDEGGYVKRGIAELAEVFWEKLVDFWGAVLALFFGLILFLIRGKLKRWFGYDGSDT